MEFFSELSNNLNKEHGKIIGLQNEIMNKLPSEKMGEVIEVLEDKGGGFSCDPSSSHFEKEMPWNGRSFFKDEETEFWYYEAPKDSSSKRIKIEEWDVLYVVLKGDMNISKSGRRKCDDDFSHVESFSVKAGNKHTVSFDSECKFLVIYEAAND